MGRQATAFDPQDPVVEKFRFPRFSMFGDTID
jgi:hypothetical protein